MQLSANEIYQTARKACLASGYPHDRAEDVAYAVSWLQSAGFDGCNALLDMLAEAKKDYLSADLRPEICHVEKYYSRYWASSPCF